MKLGSKQKEKNIVKTKTSLRISNQYGRILILLCLYFAFHNNLTVFLFKQVLPDGTPWIPNLVKVIVEVVSYGSEPVVVDQKLIDGPNPNNWGKRFIPLIFALQVSLLPS
jgi:hypothetical protein